MPGVECGSPDRRRREPGPETETPPDLAIDAIYFVIRMQSLRKRMIRLIGLCDKQKLTLVLDRHFQWWTRKAPAVSARTMIFGWWKDGEMEYRGGRRIRPRKGQQSLLILTICSF